MPTISTVISHSQPPTPTPVASESPAGALVPTQDYFPMRQFLLVDDNPINLKILICFMKKLKQSYETASNGEEAVMSYKADPGRYACILMDISMPVMDGLEATRQIRAFERYNDIKPSLVLTITGLASEPTRDEATRSGVDFFVTKPAKIKELEVILTSQGLLS
jgi:CheY-like chemotaxis protein